MPSASVANHGGHHRRRRRRKSDSYDEGDDSLPTWKLGMVVAIVIVCFGVLYPSMFHPMLVSLFSRGQQQQQSNPQRPPIHPAMNSPRASAGPRPDIHPAMRMAPQPETQAPSGKGMFTWMLPLYTVGVVVFLVYTLFKSKKKRKSRRRYLSDDEYESESEDESERNGRMGKRQLHDLQTRLKETELAMSKILQQIESVSKSEQVATALSKTEDDAKAQEALVHSQAKEGYVKDLENALRQFKELSDSYEKGHGMPAERRHYGDESEEEEDDDEEGSIDEEIDEEEEVDNEQEIEGEVDEPEPGDKEDSEAEVPEEPEPEHSEVEEPIPDKAKHVRRRQRRT
ncbi:hypothetical protein QR680_002613 [Steinernema hermaphroditum]|uniref:Resistance to inhibitors of cholinesterase protein 3 N-terminal domain-containing protein n=1 Tax=Steinernema hermaphroditum TaxID=289476 RepID=A0AA39H5H2_9BILA|nr:hypothetical protein QR680_002613 [Steinernema hermaphroditum]